MNVVTRFAPSPTGYLHIGGARTALFCWLYARRHGGKFRLRIEDTDKERSTKAATDAILDGLNWLGLQWDDDIIYQASGEKRHAEVAHALVKNGHAYYCYCSPEELQQMRDEATAQKKPFQYNRTWRDADPALAAKQNVKPVVRMKMPLEGETVIEDKVQGKVTVQNKELDDLIILRSDGTPTYMLAVVVDDHDMGITHVIRGDDHLNNAFKQVQIFKAMGWAIPAYAHIPLIHGSDGAKLSKRHGALGVDAYRDMGYLPEALRNYLVRLGWSHGDDEIFSTEQAIAWFDLEHIGRSPARIDFAKMENVNAHYMKHADDAMLVELLAPKDELTRTRLLKGMKGLKERAKTVKELVASAAFYGERPAFDTKAAELMKNGGTEIITGLLPELEKASDWTEENLQNIAKAFAEAKGIKLGAVAQPLRAGLTGALVSPSVFEVMQVLGKEESLARLKNLEIN